jgi:hypothetical protein
MSAVLPSDVAVSQVNSIQSLVAQLNGILANVRTIVAVNASNPMGNNWNALNTTALAGDGTLGTADGTPNTAHKIDSRVYTALNRAVSATDATNGLQCLVDFNAFMNGTAVSANAARPAQVNALTQ